MSEDTSGPQRPSRDLDREETTDNTGPEPDKSRTYRFFVWLQEHPALVLLLGLAVGLGGLLLGSTFGFSFSRSAKIFFLSGFVTVPLVGRPVGRKVESLLWDPSFIWLVDIDARYQTGAIYRVTSQRFREEWDVTDGNLDWWTPDLAAGRNVDLEEQTVQGTWRGTLTDRELLAALEAIKECREQLEENAKKGYKFEMQGFGIIRRATVRAVRRIVRTFEKGTLPDEGDAFTDEIDDVLDDFDLERKLDFIGEDSDPESDVPGLDADPLDPDADVPEQEAPADD